MSYTLTSPLLGPVIALNGWTLLMEIYMFSKRLPVFTKLKEASNAAVTKDELAKLTPAHVRWSADNFNNLMEQPTNFYAVALALAIIRRGGEAALNGEIAGELWDKRIAWAYVGLRVVHSIFQVKGTVLPRFQVFVLSSVALAALTVRGALALM